MEIYDVNLGESERLPKPRRLLHLGICLACGTGMFLVVGWLTPGQLLASLWPGHRMGIMVGASAIMFIPWSSIMSTYFSSKRFRLAITEPWAAYRIIVEEDRMRTRNFNAWNWMLAKAVHRGQVITVL